MSPSAQAGTQEPRVLSFSGYYWSVKASTGLVGPGPNQFSDDPANVSLDGQGRLRLAIVNRSGVWTSAEIINQTRLGYGTYTWTLDGDVTQLAPQAVLGMFTWSDDPSYANREIDIEFSKWGNPSAKKTGWYAIQTGVFPTPLSSNFAVRKATSSVHTFTWRPGSVQFQSTAGGRTYRWSHTGGDVAIPGDETPRINLWLYEGKAPSAGVLSVVVRGFSFRPLA
jgi:hypothetical protein